MFPGVDGFHWSPAHMIFLSAFGMVIAVMALTLALALLRTVRDQRAGRAAAIAWQSDFEDLPRPERMCRHALAGAAPGRVCERGFDCGKCEAHPKIAALETRQQVTIAAGLEYPETRLYHRGHAWVEPQGDGTALVGLDDLGARVIGTAVSEELPAAGTRLSVNGPAWRVRSKSGTVWVRAPLDGVVVAQGAPGGAWRLRVKPDLGVGGDGHLLRGDEARAWANAEMDRLMILLSNTPAGAALADGGTLAPDLHRALPNAPWDEISAAMFLNV